MKATAQQILKKFSIHSHRRGWLLCCLMAVACFVSSSLAFEYEVDGKVSQTTYQFNGTNLFESALFTVYVRDCGWLIKITETNESSGGVIREIGSTNGTEIYEYSQSPYKISRPAYAMIQSNSIPVGWLDEEVVGHIWLMFASQCYWPKLNSDQLTPIYDWQASVGNHGQNRRVSAEWNLLNGPGSLPREVIYFDALGKTNAIYEATGSKSAGGTLIPTGFVFERHQNSKLDKHLDAEVTAIRPVCSRGSLIPSPDAGAIVVDVRFDTQQPDHLPTYRNPVSGQWPTIEEARILAGVPITTKVSAPNRMGTSSANGNLSLATTVTDAPVLSLTIRCTNEAVKAGDEISIEFRITNRGTNDYKYSDRTYDRSGRMDEYKLTATNESGAVVPDPRASNKNGWFGGGLYQYAILKPGQSFTKIIPLNRWALVKEPGRYTVVGTYPSEIYSTNYTTVSSDPITVTVLPRTADEMDAYINDLASQLDAKLMGKPNGKETRPPVQGLNEVVMKLMFTCNPKIVPSLLKSMYDYGSGGGFWESEAIRFYVPHSTEVRTALIEAATQHGLGPNWTMSSLLKEFNCTKEEMKPLIARALASENEQEWAAGAGLAQQFGDDAFTKRLVAIAKTPRISAQTAAIEALAFNRTDEGVKTLKELLNDPHQNIWTPLAFAIQNAYNYRRNTMGRPLRPDDFTVEDMKPLIERLMSPDNQNSGLDTGIGLIGQFGGDEFTARLIAIATSPDNNGRYSAIYALALNRTDDGVKILKTLLADPDPKVSKMTEDALRNAYTSHGNSRGRLLRPEDFDAKFREAK